MKEFLISVPIWILIFLICDVLGVEKLAFQYIMILGFVLGSAVMLLTSILLK